MNLMTNLRDWSQACVHSNNCVALDFQWGWGHADHFCVN